MEGWSRVGCPRRKLKKNNHKMLTNRSDTIYDRDSSTEDKQHFTCTSITGFSNMKYFLVRRNLNLSRLEKRLNRVSLPTQFQSFSKCVEGLQNTCRTERNFQKSGIHLNHT